MQEIYILFSIVILIFSAIIHEVAHGAMANWLGDPTARLAGRLTLNPFKHIDPIGSVLLPVALALSGLPVFGYAIPVPFNPYNLRGGKWGPALVAVVGPLSNLLIAIFFGLVLRFSAISGNLADAFATIVFVNLTLAVFNIIPIPPLDGSKVLFAVLPYKFQKVEKYLEQYRWALLFILIFFAWQFILPVVLKLFTLIIGITA